MVWRGVAGTPLLELPLKLPREGDYSAGVLNLYHARALAVDATVRDGAATMQQSRDRLAAISKLSIPTADGASAEYLRPEARIARLAARLDDKGDGLGRLFKWRDAWRPKLKTEKSSLEWERAALWYNAAAANSFSAARAQERGPSTGGLKAAVQLYQVAAGCLEAAHDLVKPNIWGLTPAWKPDSLTPDLGLDCLCALRDLMLAHAQQARPARASPACLTRLLASLPGRC